MNNSQQNNIGNDNKGNKAINNSQNKKKTMDLNVYNYDVEELAAILNWRNSKLKESKIKERIIQ